MSITSKFASGNNNANEALIEASLSFMVADTRGGMSDEARASFSTIAAHSKNEDYIKKHAGTANAAVAPRAVKLTTGGGMKS